MDCQRASLVLAGTWMVLPGLVTDRISRACVSLSLSRCSSRWAWPSPAAAATTSRCATAARPRRRPRPQRRRTCPHPRSRPRRSERSATRPPVADGRFSPMNVTVRPLREADLVEADRIFRLAFGTFVGLDDPMEFAGDSQWIAARWRADPSAAFAADVDGRFAGSNLATNWGSIGFFGPLSVHPDFWNRGVARRLLEPTMACFERWGTRHAGLFTFAQSPKHVSLYQRFGFYPRFLIAIMDGVPGATISAYTPFSAVAPGEREALLTECRALT